MKVKTSLASLACILLGLSAYGADDELVRGFIRWQPGEDRDANEVDRTDYWSAIAVSPSTGKYGATCWVSNQDNALRIARANCNAKDARVVVLCGNGWCSLALGAPPKTGDWIWGVGWAETREQAERFALEYARERDPKARVVYSINAREFHATGAIAYSPATGKWGYSYGYGRGDISRAIRFSGDPEARSYVTPTYCSWLALATGEKGAYGWGHAGNRADAERTALEECARRGANAKIAVSFCTNGKVPEEE